METIRFFKETKKAIKYDFQGRIIAVVHNVKNYGQAVYALNNK